MGTIQNMDFKQMRNVDVRTVEREAWLTSAKYILTLGCPVSRGWRILCVRLGIRTVTGAGRLW